VKLELPAGVEMKDYTTTTLIDTYLGLKAEQGRVFGREGVASSAPCRPRAARASSSIREEHGLDAARRRSSMVSATRSPGSATGVESRSS
jgi:hypothetical protein